MISLLVLYGIWLVIKLGRNEYIWTIDRMDQFTPIGFKLRRLIYTLKGVQRSPKALLDIAHQVRETEESKADEKFKKDLQFFNALALTAAMEGKESFSISIETYTFYDLEKLIDYVVQEYDYFVVENYDIIPSYIIYFSRSSYENNFSRSSYENRGK